MIYIWVDDIRETPKDGKDWNSFNTTNDAVKFIRRRYKEGHLDFYLDLDHDAGDYGFRGGDYINILLALETYTNMGRMHDLNISCHFHSMNPVGVKNMQAICEKNNWSIV